jgi:hypothetical protein
MRLKLNGTHQLLVYADDVNLLGNKITAANDNTEPLIDASENIRLEVHTEITTYLLICHLNAGQNK